MASIQNLDTADLSKEDLLKMLKRMQQTLSDTQEKLSSTQTELDSTKSRLSAAEAELEQSNEEKKELGDEVIALRQILTEGYRQAAEMTANLNHRVIILDDVLSRSLTEQVQTAFDELVAWMQDYKSQFKIGPFTKGADLKSSKKELNEAKEKVTRLQGSLSKAGKSINRVTSLLTESLKTYGEIEKSPYGKAAADINTAQTPNKEEKPKKESRGRQSKNRRVSSTIRAKQKEHSCTLCNGHTEVYETGKLVQKVLGASHKLNDVLKVMETIHDIEICSDCGHVSVAISDRQDLPIIPNREISIDYALSMMDFVCRGMSLNNYVAPLKKYYELGNDTLSYSLHDFTRIYIQPLYHRIMDAASKAPVLLLDGTPFDCLESQGRRRSKDRKAEDVQISRSNYILSMTSPMHAAVRFVAYGYLEKRNAESIKKIITSDFKFSTLVTDGFQGYTSLAEEHPGMKLQHCITHLRRYLIWGFDFQTYCGQLDVLSDEECREAIKKDITENSDKYLLFSALNAINKIYALESTVDYTSKDYLTVHRQVRSQERELLEKADIVMEEMIRRHMVPNKKGTGMVGRKGDVYAKPSVYWYQQRPYMKYFLDDPSIPLDTNIVYYATFRNTQFLVNLAA